jgi:twitching motility two-component system response regulator PilH
MGVASADALLLPGCFVATEGKPDMSEQKEILIVDDSEEHVIFLAQVLEDHGFRFRIARNGKEAVTALHEARPDLVLLDVMMPRKSGIHVFGEMKSKPGLADVPIIVITGVAGVTGVNVKTGEMDPKESYGDDFARDLGSVLQERLKGLTPDALLEKPVEPQRLVKAIRELL